MITPILLLTILCAVLSGFAAGWLMRGKRKRRSSLVSYRKEPEPYVARWTPEHGRSWR